MACLACRESKVKVRPPCALIRKGFLTTNSVMVGGRHARIAHTGVVNVATSLSIKESKCRAPLYLFCMIARLWEEIALLRCQYKPR